MKIVSGYGENVVRKFTDAEDLCDTLSRLEGCVVRVELTTEEFRELLYQYDYYEATGIDCDSPIDYSGCYVTINDNVCVQTHHSY